MTTHRVTNANDVRSGNALPANRSVLGVPLKNLVYEDLLNASDAPLVAAHTNTAGLFATPFIAASQIPSGAGYLTLNGSWAAAGVATVDWPRIVGVSSDSSSDVAVTALVEGTDVYGAPMSQLVTLSNAGTSANYTLKAFYTITNVYMSGATVGHVTVDVGNAFGLSYKVREGGWLSDVVWPNTTDASTVVMPDLTVPATNLTGDVRGTVLPNASLLPNGTRVYTLRYIADNGPNNADGFGVTQA